MWREPEPGADTATPLGETGSLVQVACAEVAGSLFGIDVRHVREVIRAQPSTPLPEGPPLLEGVIELRDAVVPVVDLARVLRGEAMPPERAARIVVVAIADSVLGLRVQSVHDVLTVEASSVDPPPRLAREAGYELIDAVIRRDAGPPILVLSLEALRRRLGVREGSVAAPPCR